MFRFLLSHQESDDAEHFDTLTFPGDVLLMEQQPLLFYSCCEFETESSNGQRDVDAAGGKGKLMTVCRGELLHVAL